MSRGTWNPWRALRERPWLWLKYGRLETCDAVIHDLPEGGRVIVLDDRLSRRARRCALAHELVHDELNLLWHPGTAGHLVMKGEAMVDRIVLDRLVPVDELEDLGARRVSAHTTLCAWEVAEEFDVTIEIADHALRRLEAAASTRGVA